MRARRPIPLYVHASFAAAWLAAIAGFAAMAAWVHGTYYLPFDKRPSIEVQSWQDYGWVDALFRAVNTAGGLPVLGPIVGAAMLLLVIRRQRLQALLLAGAAAMWLAMLAFRHAVDRPFSWDRPPEPVRVFPNADSFPSGHVTAEVLVYGLIAIFAERMVPWRPAAWAIRAVCLTIIVAGGPARLYVGAHWTSDVIGAVLLALIYLVPAVWLDLVARRRAELTEARAGAAELSPGSNDTVPVGRPGIDRRNAPV